MSMGMIVICDKCGKQMPENEFDKKGAVLSLAFGSPAKLLNYALCKDCRKMFEKWLEGV